MRTIAKEIATASAVYIELKSDSMNFLIAYSDM